MTNELHIYGGPNVGCMLGTAYQSLLSELTDALAKAGLDVTAPEYLILRALYANNGMQQCELASQLGKDKGAICRCIKTMAAKGLVVTEPVSHKCLKVYVSDKGQSIRADIMAVADERHRALTSMLTPAEMDTFVSVLQRIITNL
ncbi:MAG: MarR family winged helix-turn-helix transcriptional regulator [Duncaniella sp.]|nr:MarR family winged helix-turn-helix transcriptional regulator [Duncaniella sp.]